jgi:hypothetical protein
VARWPYAFTHEAGASFRLRQRGTENIQRPAAGLLTALQMHSRGAIGLSNLNRPNIRAGYRTNAVHGNAAIDHVSMVAAIIALNDSRVAVDFSNVIAAHAIASRMAIVEVSNRNKRVMPCVQSEVEVESNGTPIISESESRPVTCGRR